MDFELCGVRIPMAYTIGAKKDLLEAFGSLDNIASAFMVDDDVKLAENAARMCVIMNKAEYSRQKAKSMLTGEQIEAKTVDYDTLFNLLETDTVLDLVQAITGTVREANDTTVKVKEDPKAEAMQE